MIRPVYQWLSKDMESIYSVNPPKQVRFDETVTVYEFVSDKAEKREDRLEALIRILDSLFDEST